MSSANFQAALQDALDKGKVLTLEDDMWLDQPVVAHLTKSHRQWHGIDGRHHTITSQIDDGRPAITINFEGAPAGTCARSLMLQNFTFIGSGKEGGGINLSFAQASSWVVNPLLRDIWIEGAGGAWGLNVEGSIFEGNLYSVGTMNCVGHGVRFGNTPGGIVSALRYWGGTNRQNGGHGIAIDQYDGPGDVRLFGLYFCENAGYGLFSLAGMELVDACGFENNRGGAAAHIENYAYLRNCSASTYGPQPYLLDAYAVNPIQLHSCTSTGYNGGNPRIARVTGQDGAVVVLDNTDPSRCDVMSNLRVVMR